MCELNYVYVHLLMHIYRENDEKCFSDIIHYVYILYIHISIYIFYIWMYLHMNYMMICIHIYIKILHISKNLINFNIHVYK